MRKIVCLLVLCLSWPPLLSAMSVSGLYEAVVPVANQSDGERRQALHKAMWQVLVKLTGDTGIVNDGRAKPLINQAQDYIQQYRYMDPKTENGSPRLWVSFDTAAVSEALRQHGIATWGKERPATLVWLSVRDAGGEQLIGMEQPAADDKNYLQPVIQQAHARGIPLLLPLMDLEDTSKLQPADIRTGSINAIRTASARYPAEMVLAVSVGGAGGDNIRARWILLTGDDERGDSWSNEGESIEEVLNAGINRLADNLARRYAPRTFAGGDSTRLPLTVSAVNSLDDYARVQNYLAGLSGVSRVDVKEVRGDSVVFEVETLAGTAALEQAISIGRTLQAAGGGNSSAGDNGTDGGRSYQLRR